MASNKLLFRMLIRFIMFPVFLAALVLLPCFSQCWHSGFQMKRRCSVRSLMVMLPTVTRFVSG